MPFGFYTETQKPNPVLDIVHQNWMDDFCEKQMKQHPSFKPTFDKVMEELLKNHFATNRTKVHSTTDLEESLVDDLSSDSDDDVNETIVSSLIQDLRELPSKIDKIEAAVKELGGERQKHDALMDNILDNSLLFGAKQQLHQKYVGVIGSLHKSVRTLNDCADGSLKDSLKMNIASSNHHETNVGFTCNMVHWAIGSLTAAWLFALWMQPANDFYHH
jgi:hypothetical protein